MKKIIVLAALCIILASVKVSSSIVMPFLLALFLSIVFSPIVKIGKEKYKLPIPITVILIISIIVLGLVGLGTMVSNSITEFTNYLPQYQTSFNSKIVYIQQFLAKFNIEVSRSTLSEISPNTLFSYVGTFLQSFAGVMSKAFLILLIVFFMLLEAPYIKDKLTVIMGEKGSDNVGQVLKSISTYLGVKTFTSFLTGAFSYVLLIWMDVQFALLWSLIIFLLNYIPTIGSIIAAGLVIIQTLLLNEMNVIIIVAVGLTLINAIIGSMMEPKMLGDKVGIPPVVVFLSLLFWNWILGPVGMLLSIPLTIALKVALEHNEETKPYALFLTQK